MVQNPNIFCGLNFPLVLNWFNFYFLLSQTITIF